MSRVPLSYDEYISEVKEDVSLPLFRGVSNSIVWEFLYVWTSLARRAYLLGKAERNGDINHISFYYSTVLGLSKDRLIRRSAGSWKITELGRDMLYLFKNCPHDAIKNLVSSALMVLLTLLRSARKVRASELEHMLFRSAYRGLFGCSHSTFYRSLDKLITNDLIEREMVEKRKVYYFLTEKGFDSAKWLYEAVGRFLKVG